ncbi:condensation domain-containing protein [Luteipulveratus mongoliensis]|uniref:Condensation domain-containing protein n=1 Tax=Luteipulveratus mongoliensis TaxID=571913 RepID=A0A0K1JE91_9MICO|nr:condensation domain-containing protein [Luteipulveratus mongoliensis]AKU14905.1 hypothetical protein VV02_01880 [Luteipulveratus mongoliensis]
MQMTRLELHDTIAGRLIVWEPSARTRAAIERAVPGDDQPSYMQETHLGLRRAMAKIDKRDASWVGTAFDLPGELDVDAMAAALTQWVRRHAVLWGWFVVAEDGGYQRFDLSPEDIEIVPREVKVSESPSETTDFIGGLFEETCTPFDGLGYAFAAAVGADSSVVYTAADHTYTDGFSVLVTFEEVNALYQEAIGGSPAELPPAGSFMQHAQLEREVAERATRDHPAVAYWIEYALKDGGGTPRFPMDLGLEPGEKQLLEPGRYALLSAPETDALEVHARAEGATFPALVYAACALAARDLAGQTSYRFLNPISTRYSPELQHAMGWLVNLMPVHIDVPDAADLMEVARATRQTFREARVTQELPAIRVLQILSEAFGFDSDSTERPSIVSYLDGRKAPGQEAWARQRFFGLTGGGHDDDVNVWINRMPTNTYVTCSVPGTAVARANVARYFEHVAELLRAELEGVLGHRLTSAHTAFV